MSDAIDERRELKDRIIEAALVNAAFDGWTRGGLVAAGRELEIDAPTVRRLFAGRGDAALDWLDDWLDRIAAHHPNVCVLDLSSFKCGHDAPTYGMVDSIVQTARTPAAALHDLDANKPGGSIKIRVKTYAHSLRLRQEALEDVSERAARWASWIDLVQPDPNIALPLGIHLEGPFLELVCDAVTSQRARDRGLFEPEAVERLLHEPNEHMTPLDGNKLWQLGLLELWLEGIESAAASAGP